MNPYLLQVLQDARALISHPDAWTTGVTARNKIGRPVDHMEAKACAFCLLGAISRAAQNVINQHKLPRNVTTLGGMYAAAIDELAPHIPLPFCSLHVFNVDPCTKHADVLAALDKAINEGKTNRD